MRYCKKCLEPDTRPDCVFDEDGICFPCHYHEHIHVIDWQERGRQLEEVAAWGKARNVSGYDCLIPVSGGKDSHRQALFCRDELGLKPLLVSCAYPPEQQTERGADNISNLVNLGFDCVYVSPGPETWRRLVRLAFFEWGNLYKTSELALYATGARAAILYHIPLTIYGENPALSWGSAGGSFDGDGNRLKYNNTLRGGDLSWILEGGFAPKDLFWYRYPTDAEIARSDLRIVYLGYFIPDFNDFVNADVSIRHGLLVRDSDEKALEELGQINGWVALDCDFIAVNQLLKQMKLGFGKAVEQCSGAVRNGYMTREEAVELARRYDGKCGQKYIDKFCSFLDISVTEFWEVAESFRNKDLWVADGNDWRLAEPIR